jgi:lauroyl/myristoyl acyltransferase
MLSYLPLYNEYLKGVAAGAAHLGFVADARFLRRRRRYVLLDHVDLYWSRHRSDDWHRRHLRLVGAWPTDRRSFVAVFYHYGHGMLAMRSLSLHGYRASLVGRPITPQLLATRPHQLAYARARYAQSERNGGAPVIFWGGAKARIVDALQSPGTAVLGAVDVPPTEIHSLTDVQLLDRPTRLTHGLVKLARELGAPLVVFSVALSDAGNAHQLTIDPPIEPNHGTLESTMQLLADRLTQRIRRDPAAWSLWAWQAAFFGGEVPDDGRPVDT